MECGQIPARKFLYGPGKRVGIETAIRLARPDDDLPAALANAGFVLSVPENGVT
jgi:hypothetical protein